MSNIALIPMRSSSKRLVNKHLRTLLGKPLLAWTIGTAKACADINRVIVATDGNEIANAAKQYNADEIIMLPPECVTDTSPVIDTLVYCSQNISAPAPDTYILLEATSFRLPHHISEALRLMQTTGTDSIVSIIPIPGQYHPDWTIQMDPGTHELLLHSGEPLSHVKPQKQSLTQRYTRNGAIYVFKPELLKQNPPTIYGPKCKGYVMDARFTIDIDTEEDFLEAEQKIPSLLYL